MKYITETELYMKPCYELWNYFDISLFPHVALLPNVALHLVFMVFTLYDDKISFAQKCRNYLRRPRRFIEANARQDVVSFTDNDTYLYAVIHRLQTTVLLLAQSSGHVQ